jgi:hypothetical protein
MRFRIRTARDIAREAEFTAQVADECAAECAREVARMNRTLQIVTVLAVAAYVGLFLHARKAHAHG